MQIEGKWVGQYTYGEDYPAGFIGKSIAFELNVISSGIEFSGNFSDDETRHLFSSNGTVNGFLESNHISFTKQYPKAWEVTEEGAIKILENTIPPSINYEGMLDGDQFEGNWEIHQYYLSDDGSFSTVLGAGTWHMRKA